MPDPQAPATFQRSKLTGEGDPAGLRELHVALLTARRRLPAGEADEISFDEHQGWLRVRRGPYELVANFGREPVHVPVERPVGVELASHHATVEPGHVVLPALSGALLR